MKNAHIYLNFNGQTEEAFNFYKSVLGGEFIGDIYRFEGTPDADKLPDHLKNKIMHMALPLPNGVLLMGTDAMEEMGQKLTMGNNFYIYLAAESKDEADTLFSKLSEGGAIEMPLADMFWGSYYGAFKDKYGVQWMVSFDENES
ncbi:MAG: VOC family protein [Melioribacteraceae bacterium]|nr:MAG: VOC family protein [Melioribacteraceae bacterium]